MSLRVELLSGADGDLQHIFNQLEDYGEFLTWVVLFAGESLILEFQSGGRVPFSCSSCRICGVNQKDQWIRDK
jgi:hypothetical protein